MIEGMLAMVEDGQTEDLELVPEVLFEMAALGSGWDPREPTRVSGVVERLLRSFLGQSQSIHAQIAVKPAPPVKQASQDEPEAEQQEEEEEEEEEEL